MAFNGSGEFLDRFFGISAPLLSNRMAFFTRAPLCAAFSGILRGIFMPLRTVGFGLISLAIRYAAKSQAFFINLLIGTKNTFSVPSQIHTVINSLMANARNIRPLHNGFCNAIKRYKAITISVLLLLGARCPSTIFFRIIKIVINSINSHKGFRLTHVGKELSKIFAPFLGHRNPTPSIPFKKISVRIIASLFYATPNRVSASFRKIMCLSHVSGSFNKLNAVYHRLGGYAIVI